MYISFQGLAMKRAGAFGEAEALYEAGLQHVASSACARIAPPERESLRIMLLKLLITLHSSAGNEHKSRDAFARLFQPVVKLLKRNPAVYAGNAGSVCYLEFVHEDDQYTATCTTTGRVFAVVEIPKQLQSLSSLLGVLTEHQAIVEQRRGGGGVTQLAGCADPVLEPLRRGAQVQKLPRVPRLACAGCGAPQRDDGAAPMQRCAACAQVAYCCRACQVRHWPAHKAACKAARRKTVESGAEEP